MLYSLQYARAIAALFVVHAHLAGFPSYASFAPSGVGGLGVDIFFVISGYIVAGLGRVAVNRGWLPDSAATSALLCAVAVLACCAAALVSYIVIERGLGKYLGSLINTRSGAPAAASTSNPLDSPRAG